VEGVAGATNKELRVSDGRESVSAPGKHSRVGATLAVARWSGVWIWSPPERDE